MVNTRIKVSCGLGLHPTPPHAAAQRATQPCTFSNSGFRTSPILTLSHIAYSSTSCHTSNKLAVEDSPYSIHSDQKSVHQNKSTLTTAAITTCASQLLPEPEGSASTQPTRSTDSDLTCLTPPKYAKSAASPPHHYLTLPCLR